MGKPASRRASMNQSTLRLAAHNHRSLPSSCSAPVTKSDRSHASLSSMTACVAYGPPLTPSNARKGSHQVSTSIMSVSVEDHVVFKAASRERYWTMILTRLCLPVRTAEDNGVMGHVRDCIFIFLLGSRLSTAAAATEGDAWARACETPSVS